MQPHLLEYDHVDNQVFYRPEDHFDYEKYDSYREVLMEQLQFFDNMGIDIVKESDIDDRIRTRLFQDIIEFVDEHYLNIVSFINNENELAKISNTVYQFLCIDCFNILLPKLIEDLQIVDIASFDRILRTRMLTNPHFLKDKLRTTISDILKNLLKLQNLDHNISEDKQYRLLVEKFGHYLELIEFCDQNKFLVNYIRPNLSKNFHMILWRTL